MAALAAASALTSDGIAHGFSLSFLPDAQARAIGLALIPVFCLLAFGLYGIVAARSIQDSERSIKGALFTTLACLSLLPFYWLGEMNDLVSRARRGG